MGVSQSAYLECLHTSNLLLNLVGVSWAAKFLLIFQMNISLLR